MNADPPRSYVVATAGHVDHGKSALVRALTGIEPDRWEEEQRRGMTIGLGFAWTRLPSGADVAFVDVPGHERFVSTMLAGAGPVPAVLLVVAADEGWSAQTEEHVAALDALGVRHGLVAVTKADLADPQPVIADVRQRLAQTSLRGAGDGLPAVAVSARTGEGLDELRGALDRLLADLPAPDETAPVRLWVDRSFTIRGAGTVVTGTLGAGTLSTGDELSVVPGGRPVAVRGLQSEQQQVDRATPTRRTAVNLRGVERSELRRGDALVSPGRFTVTGEIDVVLTRPGSADAEPPTRETTVHIGAAAVPARIRPLDAGVLRLRLARPLPLHVGDRLLLRDPGRGQRIAGADVADVDPLPLTGRGAARARATRLRGGGTGGSTGATAAGHFVADRGLVAAPVLGAAGFTQAPSGAIRAGGWWCSEAKLGAWRDAVRSLLAEAPDGELPQETVRRRLDLPDAELLPAVLAGLDNLVIDGDRVRDTARARAPESAGMQALRQRLAADPLDAPDGSELAGLAIPARELARACADGDIVALGSGVYVGATAIDRAVGLLGAIPQPFTVAAARQAIGVTRRVAVPLLEELDRRRLTRRMDEAQRILR